MQSHLENSSGPKPVILSPTVTPLWYAVRVRSNFERTVSSMLEHKGIEQFLPTYRSRRIWADRIKTLDLPLFPGYVFCRIPVHEKSRVVSTDGVVKLIGAGRQPIAIRDAEIEAIRTVVESRLAAEPWPFLRVGERVRIRRGPLAGLEGILIQVKNSYRLIISVTLLERSVAVEIDAVHVSPVH